MICISLSVKWWLSWQEFSQVKCCPLTEVCFLVPAGASHSVSGVSVLRAGPRLVFLQSPAERAAVRAAVPSAQRRGRVSGSDSHTRSERAGGDAPPPRTRPSAGAARAAAHTQETLVRPRAAARKQD